MAASFALLCTNDKDYHPFVENHPSRSIAQTINWLNGVLGGANKGAVAVRGLANMVRASGTLTLSGAEGTVGVKINGVSVTVDYDTSDEDTASLLAAAINNSGNDLVGRAVEAEAAGGVVTITALRAGVSGNWITIEAVGTGATASGARLTGGDESGIFFFS